MKFTITILALVLTLAFAPYSSAQTTPPPGSQDKNREEQLRKDAEIEEKNRKIAEANAIIARTFTAGTEALKAKDYDEAIRLFDEGIAADPEQPALLVQKAVALKARGVDRFNATLLLKDENAKAAGLVPAKKDFTAAVEAAKRAVDLMKAHPVPTDPQELVRHQANKEAAFATYAETMRLFVRTTDPLQVDVAEAAYLEYLALVEVNPAKKTKVLRDLGAMLLDASSYAKALATYKKILEFNPDDPGALFNAGVILSLIASDENDRTKYEEAAKYLQRFMDKAPAAHELIPEAKALLEQIQKSNAPGEKN